MPKKIKETTERYCCQWRDLKPTKESRPIVGNRGAHSEVECIHCGKKFQYDRFTDAAGSMDWTYESEDGVHPY